MKSEREEIAAKLVLAAAPKLSTQDVANYLDIKPVTLRSWITREYVRLFDSERGSIGRGNSNQFSPLDVVQLIICAKMTIFTIAPGFLTAKFAREVTLNVLDILHTLAGTENYAQDKKDSQIKFMDEMKNDIGYSEEEIQNYRDKDLAEFEPKRYYYIYYSPLFKKFSSATTEKFIGITGGIATEPVILVFDCLDVAEKLIAIYRKSGTV